MAVVLALLFVHLFRSALCQEEPGAACTPGFWGPDCKRKCGNCLMGGACKKLRGECVHGCVRGWTSLHCNESCRPGTYGLNCERICGKCKAGTTCDRFIGECYEGCAEDWLPPNCIVLVEKGSSVNIFLILGITIFTAFLLLTFPVVVWISRRWFSEKPVEVIPPSGRLSPITELPEPEDTVDTKRPTYTKGSTLIQPYTFEQALEKLIAKRNISIGENEYMQSSVDMPRLVAQLYETDKFQGGRSRSSNQSVEGGRSRSSNQSVEGGRSRSSTQLAEIGSSADGETKLKSLM